MKLEEVIEMSTEFEFDAKVKEADDIDIKEYSFSPTLLENGVIDYSNIEHDKIFLVNKHDILEKEKPDWIPELDLDGLMADEFLPTTIKSSDGFYYVQAKKFIGMGAKSVETKDLIGKNKTVEIQEKKYETTVYKMSSDILAATVDYYIKKQKALNKQVGKKETVGLPRRTKSMYTSRFQNMVDLLRFIPEYKENEALLKHYPNRSKSEAYRKQNKIIFDQYKDLLGNLKDKILDLNLDKIDYGNAYTKGEITSYGDTGLSNSLYEDFGVRIKKQNGSTFSLEQKNRVESVLKDTYTYYGDLSNISKDFNLKVSYADNCRQHARKAIGLFTPYHNAIGVSFFDDNTYERTTAVHEFAHFLDYTKGNEFSYRYASDKDGSLENQIATKYKKLIREQNENNKSKVDESKTIKLGDYWYRTCECFARAMEQDFELTIGLKEKCEPPAYLPEEIFNKEIKPLIEELKKENEIKLNLIPGKFVTLTTKIKGNVMEQTKDYETLENVFEENKLIDSIFQTVSKEFNEKNKDFFNFYEEEKSEQIENLSKNISNIKEKMLFSKIHSEMLKIRVEELKEMVKRCPNEDIALAVGIRYFNYFGNIEGNISHQNLYTRFGIGHYEKDQMVYPKPEELNSFISKLYENSKTQETYIWKHYEDGSCCLKAPNGEEYFVYDPDADEVKITKDSNWIRIDELNLGDKTFTQYAEDYVLEKNAATYISFETNGKNIEKEQNVDESKQYSFFVKDTAEFEMFEEFETITGLTAREAISEYKRLREDGLKAGIGINIPSDTTFDDPKGLGTTILVRENGIDTFDIYGDSFIVDLKENNEKSQNRIAAYKELCEELQRAGLNVKEPKFLFEKEKELGLSDELTNTETVTKEELEREKALIQERIKRYKEELSELKNTDPNYLDEDITIQSELIRKLENQTDEDIKKQILWKKENQREQEELKKNIVEQMKKESQKKTIAQEGDLFSYNETHPSYLHKNKETGREISIQPEGLLTENIKNIGRLKNLSEATETIEKIKSMGFDIHSTASRVVIFNDDKFYDFDTNSDIGKFNFQTEEYEYNFDNRKLKDWDFKKFIDGGLKITKQMKEFEKIEAKNTEIKSEEKQKINTYIPKPVTLEEILSVMDFKIDISDSGKIKIFDNQWGEYIDNGEDFEGNGNEAYEFTSASEIFERLDTYISDYIINDMIEQLNVIGAEPATSETLEDLCHIFKNELEKGNTGLSEGTLNLAMGIVEPNTVIMPEISKNSLKIEIPQVLNYFDSKYELFYDSYPADGQIIHNNNVYDKENVLKLEKELVLLFDSQMKENEIFKTFVQNAAKERGDIFSSDRECAALLMTIKEIGLEKELGFEIPELKRNEIATLLQIELNQSKITEKEIINRVEKGKNLVKSYFFEHWKDDKEKGVFDLWATHDAMRYVGFNLEIQNYENGKYVDVYNQEEKKELEKINQTMKNLLNEYSSELIERMNNNSNKFLFIFEKLQAAGIEVVFDKEEFDRILEREKLLQKMTKKLSEFEDMKKELLDITQRREVLNSEIALSQEERIRQETKADDTEFKNFCKTVKLLTPFIEINKNNINGTWYSEKIKLEFLSVSTNLNDDNFHAIEILNLFSRINGNYYINIYSINELNEFIFDSHKELHFFDPYEEKIISINSDGEINDTEIDEKYLIVLTEFKKECNRKNFTKQLEDTIYEELKKKIETQRVALEKDINTVFINKNVGILTASESNDLKQKLYKLPYVELNGIKVYANKIDEVKPSQFLEELGLANILQNHDYDMFILPEQYTERNKHADTLANDEFLDLKNLSTKKIRQIGQKFSNAKEQGKNVFIYLNNDFSEKEVVDEINWRILHDLKIPQANIEGKLIIMFGKSNQYLEYKIEKDGIQPIKKDRGIPPTRAGGLNVYENIPHAQPYINISQTENKSTPQNFITQDGTTYGFAFNGKIYLNPEIISSEAALHEYTHLWDNYTKVTNPELWQKGKEIFKNTNLWEEVKNEPNYQDLAHDEDLILSECHARITGKIADKILDKIQKENGELTKDTVIDWNKEVFEYISKEFVDKDIDIQSVSEFVSQTMKDFMEGRVMQKIDSYRINHNHDYFLSQKAIEFRIEQAKALTKAFFVENWEQSSKDEFVQKAMEYTLEPNSTVLFDKYLKENEVEVYTKEEQEKMEQANNLIKEIVEQYSKELFETYNQKEMLNKFWSKADIVDTVPDGWKKTQGVTTVPNGYVAITNGKSRFADGEKRETKLIREENYKQIELELDFGLIPMMPKIELKEPEKQIIKEEVKLPFSIINNVEKGRVNIKFDQKISDKKFNSILKELKSAGWRFSSFNKQWYPVGKAVEKSETFVKELQEKYAKSEETITYATASFEEFSQTLTESQIQKSPYDGIKFFDRNYKEIDEFVAYFNRNLNVFGKDVAPIDEKIAETIFESLQVDRVGTLNSRTIRLGLDASDNLVLLNKEKNEIETKNITLKELFFLAKETLEKEKQSLDEMLEKFNKKDNKEQFISVFGNLFQSAKDNNTELTNKMDVIFEAYIKEPTQQTKKISKVKPLKVGDSIGDEIVQDVFEMAKGVYQATLMKNINEGPGTYFILDKNIVEKLNPELHQFLEEKDEHSIFETSSRTTPHIIKELIDKKLCPPRDNEYYHQLVLHTQNNPLKYEVLYPVTKYNFKNKLKQICEIDKDFNHDVLTMGKQLLSFATENDKREISRWLRDDVGCDDEKLLRNVFSNWVSEKEIKQEKKKDGYPPRGE